MSTFRIGGFQCVPYAECLGTCICVSVSSTFATKNTYIFRSARLPKPKVKQISQIIRDFFSHQIGPIGLIWCSSRDVHVLEESGRM